jgi:[ribosomal protein S5]-alanine N-acetyltransferase
MSLPFPISVATGRVLLRPVAAEDLPDLMAVNGDAEVVRFLPYAAWTSLKDAEAWLARMQALETAASGRQYVLLARETGMVIGTVLLFRHDAGSSRAELGYVLGRRHWGQGLMREALTVLCAALFDTGALRRLEAEVNPDNRASAALLLALGFVAEGRARQRWVARGRAYDVDRYGLLQGELTRSAADPMA